MNIYIDESGLFIKPEQNKCAISAIGALVIPENKVNIIFSKFESFKKKWGFIDTEVKGSKLNELQVNNVIDILQKYNVMFEVVAIDMNIENNEKITAHKFDQAQKMVNCITDEFNETLIENLYEIKKNIESLPNQLYVQAHLSIELLRQVFQKTMLNFSLKRPKELEFFTWIVDAKDSKITLSEKVWKSLVLPLAQTKSFDKPLMMIEEGDYTYFFKDRNSGNIPDYLIQHIGDRNQDDFFELNSVYSDIKFEDSKNNLGIQLADILTTSIRRSMNGNFQKKGWKHFGKIIFMGENHSISLISLQENSTFDKYEPENEPPYFNVITYLDKTCNTIFS